MSDNEPSLARPLVAMPLHMRMLEALDRAEKASKRPSCVPDMRFGAADLDAELASRRLVAVAGRPSIGKTAVALRIAQETARVGHVLYASTLSESQALTLRLLSSEAHLPLDEVRRGRLAREEWTRLSAAAERLGSTPLWLADASPLSLAELRAETAREQNEHGLDLLVVDAVRPWIRDVWPILEELASQVNCSVLAVCDAGQSWYGHHEEPLVPPHVPCLILDDDDEQPPLALEERWVRLRLQVRGTPLCDLRARVSKSFAVVEPT